MTHRRLLSYYNMGLLNAVALDMYYQVHKVRPVAYAQRQQRFNWLFLTLFVVSTGVLIWLFTSTSPTEKPAAVWSPRSVWIVCILTSIYFYLETWFEKNVFGTAHERLCREFEIPLTKFVWLEREELTKLALRRISYKQDLYQKAINRCGFDSVDASYANQNLIALIRDCATIGLVDKKYPSTTPTVQDGMKAVASPIQVRTTNAASAT